MHFKAIVLLGALATGAVAAPVTGSVSVIDSKGIQRRVFDGSPIVWLDPLSAQLPVSPKRAVMLQKNKRFSPHELVIGAGSTVNFPNLDPIFHNAFSSFDGQIFDIGLYPPGKSREIQFHRPGVVRVFCNIHPSMSAVILVLNTPYWASSDEEGRYALPDVSPGDYVFHVFYEKASADDLTSLSRRVTVKGGLTEIQPISIPESKSLLLPHKNKYGKDYMPTHDQEYGLPK